MYRNILGASVSDVVVCAWEGIISGLVLVMLWYVCVCVGVYIEASVSYVVVCVCVGGDYIGASVSDVVVCVCVHAKRGLYPIIIRGLML